jgi:hypothetical protein
MISAWARRTAVFGALLLGLAACAEPSVEAKIAHLRLDLVDGQAFWASHDRSEPVPMPDSVEANWEDQVWTTPDQTALLQLPDNSQIQLLPDSRLVVRRPRVGDSRPVLRLVDGEIRVVAHSNSFVVESYREVPLALRIALLNMVLDPRGTPAEFDLKFDGDTVKALARHGAIDVQATDVVGTLLADWRAELTPDDLMSIIAPTTPTPTPSRTPTPSHTPTITPTATPTATATRVIIRFTATPTATASPEPTQESSPTNPPPPPGGGPKPQPTATNPPPPTEPPTNTPVPPTEAPRPTPPGDPPTDTP